MPKIHPHAVLGFLIVLLTSCSLDEIDIRSNGQEQSDSELDLYRVPSSICRANFDELSWVNTVSKFITDDFKKIGASEEASLSVTINDLGKVYPVDGQSGASGPNTGSSGSNSSGTQGGGSSSPGESPSGGGESTGSRTFEETVPYVDRIFKDNERPLIIEYLGKTDQVGAELRLKFSMALSEAESATLMYFDAVMRCDYISTPQHKWFIYSITFKESRQDMRANGSPVKTISVGPVSSTAKPGYLRSDDGELLRYGEFAFQTEGLNRDERSVLSHLWYRNHKKKISFDKGELKSIDFENDLLPNERTSDPGPSGIPSANPRTGGGYDIRVLRQSDHPKISQRIAISKLISRLHSLLIDDPNPNPTTGDQSRLYRYTQISLSRPVKITDTLTPTTKIVRSTKDLGNVDEIWHALYTASPQGDDSGNGYKVEFEWFGLSEASGWGKSDVNYHQQLGVNYSDTIPSIDAHESGKPIVVMSGIVHRNDSLDDYSPLHVDVSFGPDTQLGDLSAEDQAEYEAGKEFMSFKPYSNAYQIKRLTKKFLP